MASQELTRISGLDSEETPGACDQNFYFLDRRIMVIENEFSHVKEWCLESKEKLENIEKMTQELKDCIKPRMAEFGVRIGSLESQTEKGNSDNGNGNGFPNKKTIILIILTAAVVGTGGEKIINLLLKFLGVN